MSQPTESFLKVAYHLRPAKQVERRMLVDLLQRLAEGGFGISEYQYTGFGSIYFVDFIMFHKLLGMKRLLSVEYASSWERRVKFNKPFKSVDIEIDSIGNVIPALTQDHPHILWLDYDHTLDHQDISDIRAASSHLPAGSILLITTDAEPPGPDDTVAAPDHQHGPKEWREYFEEEFDELLELGLTDSDFTKSSLPKLNIDIMMKALKSGLTGRGLEFIPLVNFSYADGHHMITIGGMLASEEERRVLCNCDLKANYVRTDFDTEPFEIRVPNLTQRERYYMDAEMPCEPGWKPTHFDLTNESIEAYREVYRFFPTYAELLL